MKRGFCSIGVYHPKHGINMGGLFRSAVAFGASSVFTVGRRYRREASDTENASGILPYLHYRDIQDLIDHLPHACPLVGVEIEPLAGNLSRLDHPPVACYLLGAEDHGLPPRIRQMCHKIVMVRGLRCCLNVATTGALVLYDRALKQEESPAASRYLPTR